MASSPTTYTHLTDLENALENARCRYLVQNGWKLDTNTPGSIITYRKTIDGTQWACSPTTAVQIQRACELAW